MADEIELRTMDDHDLIVMSVMRGNETVRHLEKITNRMENHEKRIVVLETTYRIETDCDVGAIKTKKNVNLSKSQAIGVGSGLFIFGSFVAGLIYAFGQSMGWW